MDILNSAKKSLESDLEKLLMELKKYKGQLKEQDDYIHEIQTSHDQQLVQLQEEYEEKFKTLAQEYKQRLLESNQEAEHLMIQNQNSYLEIESLRQINEDVQKANRACEGRIKELIQEQKIKEQELENKYTSFLSLESDLKSQK